MTTETTNLKLKKYEETDDPNLTVQYNESMDLIDEAVASKQDVISLPLPVDQGGTGSTETPVYAPSPDVTQTIEGTGTFGQIGGYFMMADDGAPWGPITKKFPSSLLGGYVTTTVNDMLPTPLPVEKGGTGAGAAEIYYPNIPSEGDSAISGMNEWFVMTSDGSPYSPISKRLNAGQFGGMIQTTIGRMLNKNLPLPIPVNKGGTGSDTLEIGYPDSDWTNSDTYFLGMDLSEQHEQDPNIMNPTQGKLNKLIPFGSLMSPIMVKVSDLVDNKVSSLLLGVSNGGTGAGDRNGAIANLTSELPVDHTGMPSACVIPVANNERLGINRYVTIDDLLTETKVSDFTNDAGYLTDIPAATHNTLGGFKYRGAGSIVEDYNEVSVFPSASNAEYPVIPTDRRVRDHLYPPSGAAVISYVTSQGYQTASQVQSTVNAAVASAYKYKGSKATQSALPTTNNTVGDVWNVEDTGMNYGWTGTAWDALGTSFELNVASNSELGGVKVGGVREDLSQSVYVNAAGLAGMVAATNERNGVMSHTDKAKLDGIAANANNYVLPTATSTVLGGIKCVAIKTNNHAKVEVGDDNFAYVSLDDSSATDNPHRIASHQHVIDYALARSGGTINGTITRNNTNAPGMSWIGGKTSAYVLDINIQPNASSYFPLIRGLSESGDIWNFGAFKDTIRLSGFDKDRTINGTDWNIAINVKDGGITTTGSIAASGAIQASSYIGLPTANASTAGVVKPSAENDTALYINYSTSPDSYVDTFIDADGKLKAKCVGPASASKYGTISPTQYNQITTIPSLTSRIATLESKVAALEAKLSTTNATQLTVDQLKNAKVTTGGVVIKGQ